MQRFIAYFQERQRKTKVVRPFALAGPILILAICLPLLRPLRHPLDIGDDELARLATIQAIVEHHTLAIDQTLFTDTRQKFQPLGEAYYADQPPVMAAILAGPYWVMYRNGQTFAKSPLWVMYMLTLIGVTVPVAGACGSLYRMGRLFELSRPWRVVLAVGSVVGSGLLSYATALNPHAAAAALAIAGVSVLVHVMIGKHPLRGGGWLAVAGFCLALAAVIDPAAAILAALLPVVIATFRWRASLRIGGILMYCIGMLPPVLLQAAISVPITGDWRLGLPQPRLWTQKSPQTIATPGPDATDNSDSDDERPRPVAFLQPVWRGMDRLDTALLGSHGIFSHFPVMVLGLMGMATIMHRHWPAATKVMAVTVAVWGGLIVLIYVQSGDNWTQAMFASRWFVVFMPLLLFWAGGWLRQMHHPLPWALAGVLFCFSAAVSLVGATHPLPRDGYDHYTAGAALYRLVKPGTNTGVIIAAQ